MQQKTGVSERFLWTRHSMKRLCEVYGKSTW